MLVSVVVTLLVFTGSQQPVLSSNEVKLSVPHSYKVNDGVVVLEVETGADFNLNCTSSNFNHTWTYREPDELFKGRKGIFSIRYQTQDTTGQYISILSVHKPSFINTGNFTCMTDFNSASIYVFVKDRENPVITEINRKRIVESPSNLEYLCQPTDPNLNLTLNITYSGNKNVQLKVGEDYETMRLYYSRYKGFTLEHIFDKYFLILCLDGNNTKQYGEPYTIEIHRPSMIKELEITKTPVSTIVGQNSTLHCSLESYKDLSITWTIPNSLLNYSDSFHMNPDVTCHKHKNKYCRSAILTITNVSKAYSGNYTCEAEYHGPHKKKKIYYLDVIDYHCLNFTIAEKQIEVVPERKPKEISVQIISNPPLIKSKWSYNGKNILLPHQSYEIDNSQNGFSTLIIKDPKPKHSGTYTLEAENKIKKNSISINVTVKGLWGVSGPDDVIEGDNFTLECGAPLNSNSDNIQWCWTLKDGTDKKCQNPSSYLKVAGYMTICRADLNITNVDQTKSGNYTCEDKTLGKLVGYYMMSVKASMKPTINKPNDTIISGISFPKLHCNVTGVPEPEIFWYKDDKQELAGIQHSLSIDKKALTITEVLKESATFTCVATSNRGIDSLTYTVHGEVSETYMVKIFFCSSLILLALLHYVAFKYYNNVYKIQKANKDLWKELFSNKESEAFDNEIDINDQAYLLPFNKKFEFPREKLILGGFEQWIDYK